MTWPPTTLNDTQLANARIIAQVGKGLGASARDIQIAIATALQESELLNIDHGDRDSLGLFQQRSGWAPAADRMDPYRSAAMFFQGGQDGQRGLLAFKQRDQLSLTQAAQAVQVSAYPNAYAKWESLAAKYMPDLGVGDSTAAAPGISENTPTAAPTTPVGVATGAVGVAAPTPVGAVAPSAVGATSPAAPAQIQPTRAQTVIAPTGPNTSEVMTRDRFNELFPDAAHTKQFSAATSRAADGRRSDLISNAMSYMGTPYVWGGNSRDGVDCSGLIQQTYRAMGIDLPRLSSEQIRAGTPTAYKNLRPGDLIGWDLNNRNYGADHIALFVGNNQIIEAPRPGLYVRRRTLSAHEMQTALGAHFSQLG